MFQLSIVEHIRLSFGSAISAYEGHADAAWRLSVWSWYAKLATMSLVGLAVVLSIVAVQRGGAFQVATAGAVIVALIAVAAYVAFDPQPRIYGHRVSAARFWLVCEKYRSLLAEVHDELLDIATVRDRRNALLQEVAVILEQGPPADRETFEIARRALAGTHGERPGDIDRYLPPSLRGPTNAQDVNAPVTNTA